jgi:hypothetical protein
MSATATPQEEGGGGGRSRSLSAGIGGAAAVPRVVTDSPEPPRPEYSKWNLPGSKLKKIARTGDFVDGCRDREDLWFQCLAIDNEKRAVQAVRHCRRTPPRWCISRGVARHCSCPRLPRPRGRARVRACVRACDCVRAHVWVFCASFLGQ